MEYFTSTDYPTRSHMTTDNSVTTLSDYLRYEPVRKYKDSGRKVRAQMPFYYLIETVDAVGRKLLLTYDAAVEIDEVRFDKNGVPTAVKHFYDQQMPFIICLRLKTKSGYI